MLKPRIIVGVLGTPLLLFMGYAPIFFLLFVSIQFKQFDDGITSIFPIISLISLIFIIVIPLFLSYMNLKAREYRFFRDRIEFYEGFLNITRKLVRYERVTDITYTRSVWERLWGTGTIKINTAGSPYKEIRISYVRNSEKVYNDVQNLIKEFSGGMTGTEGYARYR